MASAASRSPFFHKCSDLGGEFVEFGGLVVVLELEGAAAGVEFKHLVYGFFAFEAFYGEPADCILRVGFYLLYCKHFIK